MKKFLLCIASTIFTLSCSIESDSEKTAHIENGSLEITTDSILPGNSKNPFDSKGKEYYEIFNLYLSSNGLPNSIDEITKEILFLSRNLALRGSTNKSTTAITPELISIILNNPENELQKIIESSALSADVKANLLVFLTALINQQDKEYDDMYNSIVSYEDVVLKSRELNADQKNKILEVSSISRYSLYAEARKRRDRDWETAVTNKTTKTYFDKNQVSIVSLITLLHKLV